MLDKSLHLSYNELLFINNQFIMSGLTGLRFVTKEPDLELVKDKEPTLTDLAQQAAKKVAASDLSEKLEAKKTLDDKLEPVNDLFINFQEQAQRTLAAISDEIDPILEQRDEILSDPAVLDSLVQEEKEAELNRIKLMNDDLSQNCRWDFLNRVVKAAVNYGYFKEPQLNKRGNINFQTLRFPDGIDKNMYNALKKLETTIKETIKELAKSNPRRRGKNTQNKK